MKVTILKLFIFCVIFFQRPVSAVACFSSFSTEVVEYSDSVFTVHRDLGKSSGVADAQFYSKANMRECCHVPHGVQILLRWLYCKYLIHIRKLAPILYFLSPSYCPTSGQSNCYQLSYSSTGFAYVSTLRCAIIISLNSLLDVLSSCNQ